MIGLGGGEIGALDAQGISIILTGLTATHEFGVSWAEFNDIDPGVNSCDIKSARGDLLNGALTVAITPPAPGRQRQVKHIAIVSQQVNSFLATVALTLGPTTAILFSGTLKAGDQLYYSDCRGWYVLDSTGAEKISVVDNTPGINKSARGVLAGSVNGRPIAISATASPGTVIHTHNGTGIDEVYLWANNRSGAAATLTIEWGGLTNADHLTEALSIPANSSPYLISNGEIIQGTLSIRAFSGTASAINLSGYINKLT